MMNIKLLGDCCLSLPCVSLSFFNTSSYLNEVERVLLLSRANVYGAASEI